MTNKRISETDAHALLSGRAPEGRDDLAPLAASISDMRAAAFERVVQPSSELASRLDLAAASRISPAQAETTDKHVMGLAARIALGVGVVFGTSLFATAGAGAAGVLPGPAQEAFDTVVSTVLPGLGYGPTVIEGTPSPEPTITDEGTTDHPENFGSEVSDRAKDPNKDGRLFGEETSEEAKDNGTGSPPADPGQGNGPPAENPGQGNGPPAENPGQGNGPPESPGNSGDTGPSGGTGQPEGTGKPDETGKPDGTPGGNPNK